MSVAVLGVLITLFSNVCLVTVIMVSSYCANDRYKVLVFVYIGGLIKFNDVSQPTEA